MKKIFSIILICLILIGCDKEEISNNERYDYDGTDMSGINRYVIMNASEEDEYMIFYYGIDNAMIKIGEDNYDFEGAIASGILTLDEIFSDMEVKAQLNDGGTVIYWDGGTKKYLVDNHTIIRCHTVDGNRDIYIGDENMEYEEGMCKDKITPGEIKLSEKVDLIRDTEKIIFRNEYTGEIRRKITNDKEVDEIVGMISRSREITFPVTSDGTNLKIQFYNKNDKLLAEIYIWRGGSYGFTDGKEYHFIGDDFSRLKDILDWE